MLLSQGSGTKGQARLNGVARAMARVKKTIRRSLGGELRLLRLPTGDESLSGTTPAHRYGPTSPSAAAGAVSLVSRALSQAK